MVHKVESEKDQPKKLSGFTIVLIIFSSIIILGILAIYFRPPETSNNSNIPTQPSTSNQQANSITPSEPTTRTYVMGQNVHVDELTYRVGRVQTFAKMGTTFLEKDTNGKFIKVYIAVLNEGKETHQIFTPRFVIEDSLGRKYDRLSDDSFYIADAFEFGKQLQPGLDTVGAIVFEMPKDSKDLKLIISGDWLSDAEASIILSEIEDIGIDTTLQEEQDAKTQELLNRCSAPFVCTSSCPQYMDVGQKDCSSGEVCCLESQGSSYTGSSGDSDIPDSLCSDLQQQCDLYDECDEINYAKRAGIC